MENNSNTSNKKDEYPLKAYLSSKLLENRDLLSLLKSHQIQIKDEFGDIDMFITDHGSNISINLNQQDCTQSFEFTLNELFDSLKFIISHLDTKHSVKPNIDSVEKSIKRIARAHQRLSTQSKNLEMLNQYISQSVTVVDFTKNLFSFNALKKFQTIHLFIHEKGKSTSSHYEISKDNSRTYTHSTNEFTTLFQSIKKSKNRTYGQSAIKGVNLEILGTFLAHEFSLKNHNFILIISRNDFLPQDSEEISFFNFLTKSIPSYIEILLERKLITKKIEILEKSLSQSPFEIIISNNERSNKTPQTTTYDQYTLKSGKQIQIGVLSDSALDHADIFHNERVSLLGELLNTLRHELSNPLFGLQLTTELLLMERTDPDSYEMIGEILKSIKRSQSIIENFTKLYTGTEKYEIIDISQLINEVFTLTKSESRQLYKKIISPYKNLKLNTNSTWLAQIFFNLIINSAQASKDVTQAKLDITIELIDKQILFHIKDNGPGISSKKFSEIFKAFYTTKSKGTGLGLAIAQNLSLKLGGDLSCLNNDKGAYFLLILPYEDLSN